MKLIYAFPLVAALITGVSVVSVSAKGMKHGPRMNFEEVDANSDGLVTKEEMSAYAKGRFVAADLNSDGLLSLDELQAHRVQEMTKRAEKHAARMMEHLDADNDGALSMAELEKKKDRMDHMFSRLDADEDGAISADEFAKAKKHHKKKRWHSED